MRVVNFFKNIFLILISYVLICFLVYIVSGFLLINGITPKIKLITEYQRNFYFYGGLRNIWQSREECIDFDSDLIWIPKKTSCLSKNLEYEATMTFDDFGRYSKHPHSTEKGVAVIGDSYAMGWGVEDEETFSALLEKKIKKPVYNLAVSGYGTTREILRLKKSNLLDKIDTIILQYCYNDVGENLNFKVSSPEATKEKFNFMTEVKPISNYTKLRKSIRYSATIPIHIITKKDKSLDFDGHKKILIDILKKYPILNDKKIIIFYLNGFDMKFVNFPNGQSKEMKNVYFADFDANMADGHFFQIDGHLTPHGHDFVAKEMLKILK
tara:strand:- start:8116 stop:9090 length:975 start_codon:yes stop_codon:yes gene_type:complete